MNRNVLKLFFYIFWPFLIVIGVYLWHHLQYKNDGTKERREILGETSMERAWEIADSVHLAELMEDEFYVELLDKYENMRSRMENIRNHISEAEDALYELERQGADVSELEYIISSIDSECK